MTTSEIFYTTWIRSKAWIISISGAAPVIIYLITLYTTPPADMRTAATLAILMFQSGLLIALGYESQKLLTSIPKKQITKIQLNEDFWTAHQHINRFYLSALNGHRFYEMLSHRKIYVKEFRLIAPTAEAIRAYYKTDVTVNNREHAIQIMEDSIADAQVALESLKNIKLLGHYNIRRAGTFPLDFIAILDGRLCMIGRYRKDSLRKGTIGLRSVGWIETEPEVAIQQSQYFEELWDSLQDNAS